MRWAIALVVAAGCGRVGFDGAHAGDGGSPGGDARDDGGGPGDDASSPIIPSGAKIWLRMETAPPVIVDSAGGHAVACVAGCPGLSPALHGRGYQFSGQVLDVTDAPDLDASSGFSAAAWFDMQAFPSGANVPACFFTFSFNSGSGSDMFTLCLDSAGNTVFDGETPSGTAVTASGGTVAVGAWHHMAITWDGARRRSYYDGAEVANQATPLGIGIEDPQVGGARNGFLFFGIVDDAVYYTRVLTAAEITMLATP